MSHTCPRISEKTKKGEISWGGVTRLKTMEIPRIDNLLRSQPGVFR